MKDVEEFAGQVVRACDLRQLSVDILEMELRIVKQPIKGAQGSHTTLRMRGQPSRDFRSAHIVFGLRVACSRKLRFERDTPVMGRPGSLSGGLGEPPGLTGGLG